MTIIKHDVIEEWQVSSIYDFQSKLGFKREIKAMYGDAKDITQSKSFVSDDDAIRELLEGSADCYTIDFINDRDDGYWLIRQIESKNIEIPFSEQEVQEMQEEDWDRTWTFNDIIVHLFREEDSFND